MFRSIFPASNLWARQQPLSREGAFKAAWTEFKELHTSPEFIAAFRAMHIRDDG
jgi:hypothetical protein